MEAEVVVESQRVWSATLQAVCCGWTGLRQYVCGLQRRKEIRIVFLVLCCRQGLTFRPGRRALRIGLLLNWLGPSLGKRTTLTKGRSDVLIRVVTRFKIFVSKLSSGELDLFFQRSIFLREPPPRGSPAVSRSRCGARMWSPPSRHPRTAARGTHLPPLCPCAPPTPVCPCRHGRPRHGAVGRPEWPRAVAAAAAGVSRGGGRRRRPLGLFAGLPSLGGCGGGDAGGGGPRRGP